MFEVTLKVLKSSDDFQLYWTECTSVVPGSYEREYLKPEVVSIDIHIHRGQVERSWSQLTRHKKSKL